MNKIKPKGNIETLKQLFEIENQLAIAYQSFQEKDGEYWVRYNDLKRPKELLESLVADIE